MFGQEVTLTTLEMMFTHGFIVIMLLIWGSIAIIGAPVLYMLNKTAYRPKHKEK